jgi:glycosyltransferase involved in cell wall biosynthesis
VPELVTHGVDGFLEPVGDITAQAARVVELFTSEDLYQRMAAAARRTAAERFATSLIIPQYEEYYRQVLSA